MLIFKAAIRDHAAAAAAAAHERLFDFPSLAAQSSSGLAYAALEEK